MRPILYFLWNVWFVYLLYHHCFRRMSLNIFCFWLVLLFSVLILGVIMIFFCLFICSSVSSSNAHVTQCYKTETYWQRHRTICNLLFRYLRGILWENLLHMRWKVFEKLKVRCIMYVPFWFITLKIVITSRKTCIW